MEQDHADGGSGMSDPRIIVALDFSGSDDALVLAQRLDPSLCRVKVGLELFLSSGGSILPRLNDLGFDIFLDLKFHDIPNTVAQACRAAADFGVWMINVHALGGRHMLAAACEAIAGVASRPRLIAVTLLTSHDEDEIKELGLVQSISQQVMALAELAQSSGLDGVVCSPWEAHSLRQRYGPDFLLVTPGVRPQGEAQNDQSRIMTPQQALAEGASYLVIGRPITRSPDPVGALQQIVDSIS